MFCVVQVTAGTQKTGFVFKKETQDASASCAWGVWGDEVPPRSSPQARATTRRVARVLHTNAQREMNCYQVREGGIRLMFYKERERNKEKNCISATELIRIVRKNKKF